MTVPPETIENRRKIRIATITLSDTRTPATDEGGRVLGEILRAGALGVLQSVLVVIVVWYFSFWLAKKLRLDDEFATMLSTAVSICGVSAAIAACGAIEGDRRKLSYVTFHRADSGRADDRDSALAHQTVWHSGNGRWRVARRNAGYNGLGGCGRRVDWRNGHENRNHC